MKNPSRLLPVLLLAALAAAGCRSAPAHDDEPRGIREMWVGQAIDTALVGQALVAQRTLYPYHFGTGSSELNDLGRRDLDVLAAHYAKNSGELNVRRGDAADELYRARLDKVAEALVAAGVERDSVTFADGLPGGDGRTGEQVLKILAKTSGLGGISTTSGSSGGGSDSTATRTQ